jgi:HlyD family secretion protein
VQELDDDRARVRSAAALNAAKAQVTAAQAAIDAAKAQVVGSRSAVAAAEATTARIEADIADSELKAPRDGRVQYRGAARRGAGRRRQGAQPGRPVGRLHDLLPARDGGRPVALGSEVRIVLDAAPST